MAEEFSTIAARIREDQQVEAVIVLLQHPNGSLSMATDGCNHATANSMLSLGIHLNLKQHDELVLAGAAGPAAQALAQEIEAANV